ncbi:MAG: Acyl carrier protein [Candidatus Omnitrophica bacterium ADurb.Bin277]|nr:MAG: Acyl carrier protein [Candidatus Omnitrophica bacterium ADurb.Bin277]
MKESDKEQIFLKIRKALAKLLKVSEGEISMEASLKDDLGIDSVDNLDLLFAIEDGFKLKISEEEAVQLRTVSDVVELIKKELLNG